MKRRTFLTGAAALAAFAPLPAGASSPQRTMYGLIGKFVSAPGMRDELAAILLEGTAEMPGCLSYVVASDPSDPNLLWVTEVWESKQAHAASLSLPAVRAAISRARPLIAGIEPVAETAPLGGHGLD